MSIPPADHMHAIVNLIRDKSTSHGNLDARGEKKKAVDEPTSGAHRRKRGSAKHSTTPLAAAKDTLVQCRRRPDSPEHKAPFRSRSTFVSPLEIGIFSALQHPSTLNNQPLKSARSIPPQYRRERNTPLTRFCYFTQLPPEIRNAVYHLLLTSTRPIKFPRLTRNAASRAARWRNCSSAKRRAGFKSIFLELLRTCRQLHDEASGILYGCNVFKFRSCYSEGGGPKEVVLPARHLHLLRHIKTSVLSREEWVARFLKGFQRDGMWLETFEITWFGWNHFFLRNSGLLSQALQGMHVRKHLIVKVTGEARMEKAMMLELEQTTNAARVEIHRPVRVVAGGKSVELTDDDIGD